MALTPEVLLAIATGELGVDPGTQRMANFLLTQQKAVAQQQDRQDRRWRKFSAYVDGLKAEGKPLKTAGEFVAAFKRYGMIFETGLPRHLVEKEMDFAQFMEMFGCSGYRIEERYEAENEPEVMPKCDHCRKQLGLFRCSSCGEKYCSVACQRADWKSHKPVCQQASLVEPTEMPKLMTHQEYYEIFLNDGSSTSSQPHAAPSTSQQQQHRAPPEPAPGQGKNAKKNKKKREKAKAAKADLISAEKGLQGLNMAD